MKKIILFLFLGLSFPIHALTLTIGTAPQNLPFSSLADQQNHFYGFDIDIMTAICKSMHAKCNFVPVIFNDLFGQVSKGKIDLAIAAIINTNQNDFLFSLPYLESEGQFMTLQQSKINFPIDLVGKKIGTREGTPFKGLAQDIYNNQSTVIEYPTIENLLDGLRKNEVDAIFTNAGGARYWFYNNADIYKLIGSQIPVGSGYVIMANKGQDQMIAQINRALLNMEGDGTYLKIYSRYF